MLKRIAEHISTKADEAYKYMSTDLGKRQILNPDGCKPILDIWNTPEECIKEVRCRFTRYVESFLKSEEVMVEFETIKSDIESFLKDISLKIVFMENKWGYKFDDGRSLDGVILFVGLSQIGITYALEALAFAFPYIAIIGLVFSVALLALTIAATCSQMYQCFANKRENNRKAIDMEYDNCLSSVRQIVSKQLKDNIGVLLTKMIDKVTVDMLPRRIGALEEMIEQLLKSRKEIIAKRHLLLNLASKIDGMHKDVCKMQTDFQSKITKEEEKASEGSTQFLC